MSYTSLTAGPALGPVSGAKGVVTGKWASDVRECFFLKAFDRKYRCWHNTFYGQMLNLRTPTFNIMKSGSYSSSHLR